MEKKSKEQPQEPFCISKLPKCQAIAKYSGKRCGQIAMRRKRVCYIHGGKSPGAPQKNKNAWKHGLYCKEEKIINRLLRELIRESKK